MGAVQAVILATGLLVTVVGVPLLWAWIRVRRVERGRDLSDTIAEQIAAAEHTYQTELRAAPVVGVPYVAVTDDGSHDLYPHMSDAVRDVCIGYLETLFAQPARERAS